MSTLPQIATVPFHGYQILTARDGDIVLVIMKPLVETLGLTWRTQHKRIQSHQLLPEGVRINLTPSDGETQEMIAFELKTFHGWLVTLDTRRIEDADRREVILQYQRESFQVIHDYWHTGAAKGIPMIGIPSEGGIQNDIAHRNGGALA